MKVISTPDINNWKFTGHCYCCDTKLEVYESDIRILPLNNIKHSSVSFLSTSRSWWQLRHARIT